MLTIIHGDDTAASRKYFIEQKEKNFNSNVLDGEKITSTDLAQIFDGGELFSNSKAVFVEQFFTRRKKSKERDGLIKLLQKYAQENSLYFWEGKELEKSVLNSFKNANIKNFKLPQTLFLFVDSIRPGNSKQLISLFHQTLETTDVEMIFFMMIRQIRLLLALSSVISIRQLAERNPMRSLTYVRDDKEKIIDELNRLVPWQKSKLENQAQQFSAEQLINLYNKLFKLEIGQKTGNLSSPIISSIDFLLLET